MTTLDENQKKLISGSTLEKKTAIDELAKNPDRESISALIQSVKQPDNEIRGLALNAIIAKGETAITVLQSLINDPDEQIRMWSAYCLGKMGGQEVSSKIPDILNHEDEKVRGAICLGLMDLNDPQVIPLVIDNIREDEGKKIRDIQKDLLRKLSRNDTKPIISMIDGLTPYKKALVIQILGELSSQESIDLLMTCLKDSNDLVQMNAAFVLGDFGNNKAVDSLIPLLSDPSERVRVAGATALCKIGDQKAAKPLAEMLRDGRFPRHNPLYAHAYLDVQRAIQRMSQ